MAEEFIRSAAITPKLTKSIPFECDTKQPDRMFKIPSELESFRKYNSRLIDFGGVRSRNTSK